SMRGRRKNETIRNARALQSVLGILGREQCAQSKQQYTGVSTVINYTCALSGASNTRWTV
ncbi:MAG: hypothetical protein KAJ03_11500, partial [Gammaproteobacteria bacterium]|nr:hypothetical protein [Gammaproteobacteria bacterium]